MDTGLGLVRDDDDDDDDDNDDGCVVDGISE